MHSCDQTVAVSSVEFERKRVSWLVHLGIQAGILEFCLEHMGRLHTRVSVYENQIVVPDWTGNCTGLRITDLCTEYLRPLYGVPGTFVPEQTHFAF